jgi:hypothetical protein
MTGLWRCVMNRQLRTTLVVAATVSLATLAVIAADDKRTLGPEWVRDGSVYQRTVTLRQTHSTGNVLAMQVPFQDKDEARVMETDEKTQLFVGVAHPGQSPYAEIEIVKDKDGKVYRQEVLLGDYKYVDLNADGVFDGYLVMQSDRAYIRYDGRDVRVRTQKSTFRYAIGERPSVHDYETGAEYVFVKDKWVTGR